MKKFLALALLLVAVFHAAAREIIVNTAEFPPICFVENGQARGIAIDILNETSKLTGIQFRYRFFPWTRAQMETLSSQGQAIIPLTRVPAREHRYGWIAPLFQYNFVLVTKQTEYAPQTLDDAKTLRVGVLRGNPMESMLPQMGFKDVRPEKSEDQIAKLLQANLINAWVTADLVVWQTYRKAGGNPDELHVGMKIDGPMWIYLGTSPQFADEDRQKVADAFNRLRSKGTITRIVDKYRRR